MTSNKHGRSATAENRGALVRLLPLGVLIAGTVAVFATGAHRYLKLENLISHRDYLQGFVAAHQAQAVALYMLIYVGVVGLSVPGAVFLTIERAWSLRDAYECHLPPNPSGNRLDWRVGACLAVACDALLSR